MACGQRNIHSYQPTTLAGWISLLACYLPMGVVLCLVLGCMLPYLYWYAYGFAVVIATRPSDAILAYWCWGGAVPLFTALLVSYFRCVFTSPGYSTAPQWCHPPRVLHADGHVRPSNPQSLNCSVVAAPGNPTVYHYSSQGTNVVSAPASTTSVVASAGSSGGARTAVVEDATVVSPGAAAPEAATAQSQPATSPIYHGYFTPRFCERCRMYRPQGSHHCSDCNRCVLAMDHHCPWVCNCVGARNHKYFVLFLFYIFASGIHIALTIGAGYVWFEATSRATLMQHTVNVMVGISAGVFAISMGCFFAFHIFLIASETTTVDRNIAALKGLRRKAAEATTIGGGASSSRDVRGDGAAAVVGVSTGGSSPPFDGADSAAATAAAIAVGESVAPHGGGSESGSGFLVADGRIARLGDEYDDDAIRAGRAGGDNVNSDDVAVPINSDDESEAIHKAARAGFSFSSLLSSSPTGMGSNPFRRFLVAACTPILAAIRACGLCLTSCFCRGLTPQQLKASLSATLGAPDRLVGVLIWFIPVAPTWPHAHPGRRAGGEWTLDPPEKVSPYVPTTVNYEGYVLVPPAPSLLMQGSPFQLQHQPSQPLPQQQQA